MTRADFLRREERRRLGSSLALALGAYLAAALVLLLAGLLRLPDIGDLPNPVWVDIGSVSDLSRGQVGGKDVAAPKAPVPAQQRPAPQARQGPATAPPTPSPAPAPSSGSSSPAAAGGTGAAAASPSPTSGSPADKAVAGDSGEPWIPGPRPAGSRVISTTSGLGTSGAGQTSGGGFTTKVVGDEKGNSLETVLGAGQGKSGRSLYVPIYLYMPLPKKVTDSVALRVSPQRRDLFLRTYKRINEVWVLSRDLPVAERDEVWLALEEGGYDVAHADYKAGGDLKPVGLSFVVTPASPGSPPGLAAVSLTSSSGDSAVDEAVLYGFKRASFFNATDGAISGTFVYKFSR